ncbi:MULTISPECIES: hypothetical protein [unclassified Methanosarcina]|jgi:hypothetical protein|uniref:hypothetical protein n=1 Tax=unclassified Methanosarcina TaxID=2644672 RepID=UPI0025DAF815|nr:MULTISPECIES: hypothetical protein [unclassified Methanosarcina]
MILLKFFYIGFCRENSDYEKAYNFAEFQIYISISDEWRGESEKAPYEKGLVNVSGIVPSHHIVWKGEAN